MRIVGGKFGGRKLVAPTGSATRPTTDRTRESLFNILGNHTGFEGLRVLDLFAGTGALGLEALSRGAGFCMFIDNAPGARTAIAENTEQLGIQAVSKVSARNATRPGSLKDTEAFDLAFADPPYGKGLGEKCAASLLKGKWLTSNALFVLEEQGNAFPVSLAGFREIDKRSYGNTMIGIFECQI